MQSQAHGHNNIMDLAKSQMMTMLMMKSMDNNNSGGNQNSMFYAIYMLIITQFVDFVIKYIPLLINYFYKTHFNIEKIQTKLETITNATGTTQKVLSSVTIALKITDSDNVLGQSILDHITNSNNTTHVSYRNKNFILNQKDVIELSDGIYAAMRDNVTMIDASTVTNDPVKTETQVLEIYSTKLSMSELREHLDKIKTNYIMSQKNKLGNSKYYFNMTSKPAMRVLPKRAAIDQNNTNMKYEKDFSRLPPQMSFTMKRFSTNRKFTNLFGEDIEVIKSRVKFFCNNKAWYDEKGIPYTLGLLLSGEPGTGKTSTIKCLANETGRHIFNINLNNDITKTQLENLFFDELILLEGGQSLCIPLDQRIYVLEDIDCQNNIVKQRSDTKTNDDEVENSQSIDLSFLLNLLDGVLELPGRIVIMTSNHPEMLDHALIRPGRIDVIAKFSYCSYATVVQMLEFFYDTKLSEDVISVIKSTNEFKITPAEMSRIMFENFSDQNGAVQKYIQHVKKFYNSDTDALPKATDALPKATDALPKANVVTYAEPYLNAPKQISYNSILNSAYTSY